MSWFKKSALNISLKRNLITSEEFLQLEIYQKKIKQEESFTLQEAEEFNKIAEKIRQNRPSDTGAIILAGIAKVILGMNTERRSSMTRDYKALTENAANLNSLLEHPHQDNFSWNQAIHQCWYNITKLWFGESVEESTDESSHSKISKEA